MRCVLEAPPCAPLSALHTLSWLRLLTPRAPWCIPPHINSLCVCAYAFLPFRHGNKTSRRLRTFPAPREFATTTPCRPLQSRGQRPAQSSAAHASRPVEVGPLPQTGFALIPAEAGHLLLSPSCPEACSRGARGTLCTSLLPSRQVFALRHDLRQPHELCPAPMLSAASCVQQSAHSPSAL